MAELASRIAVPSGTAETLVPVPIVARLQRPMPASLAAPDDSSVVILVLSTICRSCSEIAAQLAEGLAESSELRIVLSAPSRESALEFIAGSNLSDFRIYVDVQGAWTTGALGVAQSPMVAVVRGASVLAGYAISDVAALRKVADELRSQSSFSRAVAAPEMDVEQMDAEH